MEQEVENNNKITINSKVLLKAHNSSNVEIMLLYEWRAQRGGLMVVFTRRKELCDVVQCRQWVVGGGKGASAGAEGIHYLFIASTFISSIYLHFMKQMNSKFFLNSNLASPRHLPSRAHSTSDNPTARSFFYLDGREEDVMTWTAGRVVFVWRDPYYHWGTSHNKYKSHYAFYFFCSLECSIVGCAWIGWMTWRNPWVVEGEGKGMMCKKSKWKINLLADKQGTKRTRNNKCPLRTLQINTINKQLLFIL